MHILPRTLMITGSDPKLKDQFFNKIFLHLNNGIKLLQLRANELAINEYIELAKNIINIGRKFDAKIILNCSIEILNKLDADGIHLNSQTLMNLTERPVNSEKILLAACHNLEQLKHAEKIGVDFSLLSPVLKTKSHPEALPLGWSKFSELCKSVNTPIYALGGIKECDFDNALGYGAYGIAAISSLWDKHY